MNSYDEWMKVLERYQRVLDSEALARLHAHVSGIDYTEKGEQNHLNFEEADLDLDALLRALKAAGAKGRLLCESPILEEDALVMRDRWIAVSGEGLEGD
jgi:deoxyribonuclease-4